VKINCRCGVDAVVNAEISETVRWRVASCCNSTVFKITHLRSHRVILTHRNTPIIWFLKTAIVHKVLEILLLCFTLHRHSCNQGCEFSTNFCGLVGRRFNVPHLRRSSWSIIWHVLAKLNQSTVNNSINLNNLKKLLPYSKLNQMKRKPGLGAFYTIRLENGVGLFYSSRTHT